MERDDDRGALMAAEALLAMANGRQRELIEPAPMDTAAAQQPSRRMVAVVIANLETHADLRRPPRCRT